MPVSDNGTGPPGALEARQEHPALLARDGVLRPAPRLGHLWRLGDDDLVQVCRWSPDDASLTCLDTGAPVVPTLAPVGPETHASACDADSACEILDLTW